MCSVSDSVAQMRPGLYEAMPAPRNRRWGSADDWIGGNEGDDRRAGDFRGLCTHSADHKVLRPESTWVAVFVNVSWLVVWTIVSAWPMMTKDA